MSAVPIPTMVLDPAEVEYLRQRRQTRRRQFGAIVATAIFVLGVLAWHVGVHLLASFWLEANQYVVAWGTERGDWKQGGATSVRFVMRHGPLMSNRPLFDLKYLKNLHHLVELDLSTLYRIRDADLAGLDELKDLQLLNLDRSHQPEWARIDEDSLTDATLARIGRLDQLTELHLGAQRITDHGLASLEGLRKLESLDLAGAEITDLGLEALLRLPNLKFINLTKTKVTYLGVDAFQAKRPGVRVVADHLPIIPWTPTRPDSTKGLR